MEMMAALPGLIGAGGGIMNMINGAPANRVQPGLNPMQYAGAMFPAAAAQGYGQLAGMPNIYADTLSQYGGAVNNLMNNPGIGGAMGGANNAAAMGAGAAGNFAGLGTFLAQMGQGLTPWASDMLRQGSTQNQNTGSMMQGAQGAANLGANSVANMLGTGSLMQGVGQNLLPFASNAMQQGLVQNPNAESLMGSAQDAARMGAGAAGNLSATGAGMERTGQNLLPYANSILNTSFDPQNALYDRTRQQLQEQSRAGQSARGLANSPFGAGLENKAMSDFNIDWQNNLLGRMATGAQSASGLAGQAGNLQTAGAGLIGQAPGLLAQSGALPYQAGGTILSDILRNTGAGAQNANTMLNPAASYLTGGAGLINQTPGMMSQSSALPYQAGQTAISDQLRNMLSGAQGAGLLLDQSGRDITGGASLMGQAPGLMSQSTMLPYQAFNMIGQNQLGALGQYGQQGMLATQQPQQQLQDFYQLLGIGNNGAQVGNNIFGNRLNQANAGFNQQQQQGQNFGNAMAGLGRAFGGGQGGGGGGNQFMPTQAFMNNPNGMGWG